MHCVINTHINTLLIQLITGTDRQWFTAAVFVLFVLADSKIGVNGIVFAFLAVGRGRSLALNTVRVTRLAQRGVGGGNEIIQSTFLDAACALAVVRALAAVLNVVFRTSLTQLMARDTALLHDHPTS